MLRPTCTALCALALASAASGQSFSYPDFSSLSGLATNGDVIQFGSVLRLTSSVLSQKGSTWYDQAVSVSGGFDTTFEFQVTDLGAGGADGLAFVIQNDPAGLTALGDHASAIGYGGFAVSPTNALDNSLAIEIDTFNGGAMWGETDGNHVSIHTGGTGDNSQHEDFSIGRDSTIADVSFGMVHTLRIRYVPGLLEVYFDDLTTPVLSVAYDFGAGGTYLAGGAVGGLSLIGGDSAFVGFTASNGGSFENHDILSWDWTSVSVGTSYCLSVPNSTGFPALISASGSDSVAANDLVLHAGPVPTQPGVFFYGDTQLQLPFGNGFRCAGGTVGRLAVITPTAGSFTFAVDYTLPPSPATQITAGSTWNFQCWYRDPAAGGAFFNLSDGLAIAFAP